MHTAVYSKESEAMKIFMLFTPLFLLLAGCAGSVNYTQPEAVPKSSNSVVINKPIDAVWKSTVPELGKQFFVINNLDKSSGLINISYTGNPEKYVDCGRIHSVVKNLQGERTYDFSGASASQNYERLKVGVGLFNIHRTMNLDGRMNLIFEDLGNNTTRVTVNTRYIVTRGRSMQNNRFPQIVSDSETINFNSGESANFSPDKDNAFSSCVANGAFERDVLSIIK